MRMPYMPAQRVVEFACAGAVLLALRCTACQPLQLGGVTLVIELFDSDQYGALLSESTLEAAQTHPRQHCVLPLPHESPASGQCVLPTPLVLPGRVLQLARETAASSH